MAEHPSDTERLAREATFHDHGVGASRARASTEKFYAVTRSSLKRYRELVLADVSGQRVLEYGCGAGSAAFDIARAGGKVVGIDISPVRIELAQQQAKEQGVADRAEFRVMNAEELAFPAGSFDRVVGSGILHHLDLAHGYAEVARVLSPEGYGAFVEPLGHNPLINWYRRRTPQMRTPDEHPLRIEDLQLARQYFGAVETDFFHLFSLGAVPFRSTPLFGPLLAMAEAMDRAAMRFLPPVRRWAWMSVMSLRLPTYRE